MPLGKIINAVGGLFGLGGGQGEHLQAQTQNEALQQMAERQKIFGNEEVMRSLRDYGLGSMDSRTALTRTGLTGPQLDEFQTQFAVDPLSGSRFATEQVQQNPILGSLFGKGASMDRAAAEEQQLASRGYSLQPEDYEAYGQASGNVARLFGQQEQGLAQSLARRGLGASASGAALSGYAGLAGNKNEQLAQIQRQIADQRMNMNLQRLSQTRNYLTNMGQLGAQSIDQQFNRQLQGAQFKRQGLSDLAGKTTAQRSMENEANLAAIQDKRNAEKASLMDAVGGGILSGVSTRVSNIVGGGNEAKAMGAASGNPGAGSSSQQKDPTILKGGRK